jgi:hypothetical protein
LLIATGVVDGSIGYGAIGAAALDAADSCGLELHDRRVGGSGEEAKDSHDGGEFRKSVCKFHFWLLVVLVLYRLLARVKMARAKVSIIPSSVTRHVSVRDLRESGAFERLRGGIGGES